MHTDAYRCKQMQADASRCMQMRTRIVQTCTPQDLCRRRLSFSSSSVLTSPVYSVLRVRLSQNYYPPVHAVCNYACTRMQMHTKIVQMCANVHTSELCSAGVPRV